MKLYGKNPVLERIRSNPRSIQKLYLQKRTDLSEIVREAKQRSITFQSIDKSSMKKKCGDVHSQGVVADVEDFKYEPFSTVLNECKESSSIPVLLDGITDPQNLGGIIRSLACMGGFSIVLPEHRSVHVNETVLRVANGGENYIKITKVSNLVNFIIKAKESGVWIAGALADNRKDISETELVFPLAVVVGSEGAGIRPGLRNHLDVGISLSMRGAGLSYNAAVATALFCYEINRKRG